MKTEWKRNTSFPLRCLAFFPGWSSLRCGCLFGGNTKLLPSRPFSPIKIYFDVAVVPQQTQKILLEEEGIPQMYKDVHKNRKPTKRKCEKEEEFERRRCGEVRLAHTAHRKSEKRLNLWKNLAFFPPKSASASINSSESDPNQWHPLNYWHHT